MPPWLLLGLAARRSAALALSPQTDGSRARRPVVRLGPHVRTAALCVVLVLRGCPLFSVLVGLVCRIVVVVLLVISRRLFCWRSVGGLRSWRRCSRLGSQVSPVGGGLGRG